MVRKELVAARLEKIREYLKTLNIIQKYDLQKFKSDTFIHATAERYLHLSIECLLDIGNHIISDHGYRKPETYADIFQILAEENIISQELLKELEGMAAFRNVLVHDYLEECILLLTISSVVERFQVTIIPNLKPFRTMFI